MKTPYFQKLLIVPTIIALVCMSSSFAFAKFVNRLDSIAVSYNPNELRLPGESFKLELTAYFKNGKVKSTSNFIKNSVAWSRFDVEVNGGNFIMGRVYINEELSPSKGKYIQIKITPKRAEYPMSALLVPLNYEEKIEIIPTSNIVKAPGFSFKFKVVSSFDNGEIRSWDYGFWNKRKSLYRFECDGGYLSLNRFKINSNFRSIINHEVFLVAYSTSNPQNYSEFSFTLDYRANYYVRYSGSDGFCGMDGRSGTNGSFGGDGEHGWHGGDGGDGEDGSDVGIWADVYFDSILNCNLMYVVAENLFTGYEQEFLVNPDGGSVSVITSGGDGGDGGDGGNGGNGGRGRDGAWHETEVADTDSTTKIVRWQDPGEDGGYGGDGGHGGDGGYGGRGGDIFVYLTADAWQFSDIIIPDSNGGWAGDGGSGGSSGSGGAGGSGDPNGASGSSGSSGFSGTNGWWGRSGDIYYDDVDDWVQYE